MTHRPEDIRQFVIVEREKANARRRFSPLEHLLWDTAVTAKHGTRVITTNEAVLADPYLMRVYLNNDYGDLATRLEMAGLAPELALRVMRMPRPYLHYFFRGDDDRAFHNHPWKRSLSFILTGGYIEHLWDFGGQTVTSRLLKPGMVNYLKRDTYHRVELLPAQNCWTLFISSGRVQDSDGYDWDFYEPEHGEFTPWGKWTSAKARPRDYQSHGGESASLHNSRLGYRNEPSSRYEAAQTIGAESDSSPDVQYRG